MKPKASPDLTRPQLAQRAIALHPADRIVPLDSSNGRAEPGDAERPPVATELGPAVARALSSILARGLGFDLHAAVRARQVRLLALHTVDGRPLPRDWAIPILPAEVVVACAPLKPPLSGVAALIVRAAILPKAKLDEAARDRIAHALAEALLAERKEHKT